MSIYLIDEMSSLKNIKINGYSYNLEYILLKRRLEIFSVCVWPANSNFACIWCKCPKGQRFAIKKEWSIYLQVEPIVSFYTH
jgi:hypothetical protein